MSRKLPEPDTTLATAVAKRSPMNLRLVAILLVLAALAGGVLFLVAGGRGRGRGAGASQPTVAEAPRADLVELEGSVTPPEGSAAPTAREAERAAVAPI